MFNDDYPDYFVADDSEETSTPSTDNRVIQFTDTPSSEGNTPSSARCRWIWIVALVSIVILGCVGYFRYLSPYVESGVIVGKVVKVERRGILFKTNEADFELTDGTIEHVSVKSDSLTLRLQMLQSTDANVRARYREFYGSLPWRGESQRELMELF